MSGFGVTHEKNKQILTNKLKYARLPVVDDDECRQSLLTETQTSVPYLTTNMFCAGLPDGKKDSCQGDSGGPFTLTDPVTNQFWAAGIVSWGLQCGKTYGVYTKVTNYLDWINKIIEEN